MLDKNDPDIVKRVEKIQHDIARLNPQYGVIGMLDGLGVSTLDSSKVKKFIETIQIMEERIHYNIKGLCESVGNEGLDDDIQEIMGSSPPKIVTFGDTVVFTWECPSKEKIPDMLFYSANVLSEAICEALDDGFLFRGALTYGDYYMSGNYILGPAISDVASWYEELDMMGIVITPFCGQLLSSLSGRILGDDKSVSPLITRYLNHIFLKTFVPISKNREQNLWIVVWPIALIGHPDLKGAETNWFRGKMKDLPIPKGTESKFENSQQIFLKLLTTSRF
jgi:hypothetical protein